MIPASTRPVSMDGCALAALVADLVGRGASVRMVANGGSMSPWIRDGDEVAVHPASAATLRPGDIVAFRHPRTARLVVHRIVARGDTGWLVRGDRCRAADGVVAEGEILGRVVHVRRGGRSVAVVQGRAGAALAVFTRLASRVRALGYSSARSGRRRTDEP